MNFPQPDTFALNHAQRLSLLIQKEIQLKQFISFSRYMEAALYTPGLGYYSAGTHKLGRKGDFITAPEISPLFAQCLAQQCEEVLRKLTTGDILELGAGSGSLAKDLLLELENIGSLPKHYYILEISADLRERQQTYLKNHCPHLFSRVIWLDTLPSEKISGIILANEVLDALPTHCFKIENHIPKERCVTYSDHQFRWKITDPTTPQLTMKVNEIQKKIFLPEGYESEVNLMLPAFIHTLAHSLKQGILLFSDYGYGQREYYHPDRCQGTLMCYYQHHKHADPYLFPGLQDITSHVDFTNVIESAINSGLHLGGYTTQSAFLMNCGLLNIAPSTSLSDTALFHQNQMIKTLTFPSQMGEAIKVMALTKQFEDPLIGFSSCDRSRDL